MPKERRQNRGRRPYDQFTATKEINLFTSIIASTQWLLLTLVLFYLVGTDSLNSSEPFMLCVLLAYASFILVFHYPLLLPQHTEVKLIIATLAMIIFVTSILWYTDGINVLLSNLYFLIVIGSALILGRRTTFFNVLLIAACYLSVTIHHAANEVFTSTFAIHFFMQVWPLFFVAYLATTISDHNNSERHEIKTIADTDLLTGLLNLRGFEHRVAGELAEAIESAKQYSVIMIDSDSLKIVNDQYGHHAGDRLLKHTAALIQKSLPMADIIARYGGDEFVAVLLNTDPISASGISEKLRKTIEAKPFDIQGQQISTSVSIGIANYPGDAQTLKELIAKADRAMYQCKLDGKNKTLHYSEKTSQLLQ